MSDETNKPGGFQFVGEDVAQPLETGALVDASANCSQCVHRPVCQIRNLIGSNLEQYEQANGIQPPIQPNQIAMLCDQYEQAPSERSDPDDGYKPEQP